MTKTLRLFPHPLFAAVIASGCLLVAMIFTLMATTGESFVFAIGAVIFAAATFAIVAAIVIRRRVKASRLRQSALTIRDISPTLSTRQGSESVLGPEIELGDPFDDHVRLRGLPAVPTRNLLVYLFTVLVWETQIVLFFLHVFGVIQVDAIWRRSLVVINIVLTLLAIRLGRRDLHRLFMSRGKVELTGKQAFLVAVILLSLVIVGLTIFETVRGRG